MTLETGLRLGRPESDFAFPVPHISLLSRAFETTQRWNGCGVKTGVFLFSVSGHWEEGGQKATLWSGASTGERLLGA